MQVLLSSPPSSAGVTEKKRALASLAELHCSQHAIAVVAGCLQEEHMVHAAEQALTAIWLRHPSSADVNDMVASGLRLMRPESYAQAVRVFDAVCATDDTFAEGFNKRATLKYLLNECVEKDWGVKG